jgi:hypothetical protein
VKQTNRNALRVGDILEISTSKGLAHVQYVGKHAEYGDVIRVIPGLIEREGTDLFAEFTTVEGYLAFYPVHAAMLKRLVRITCSCPLPTKFAVPETVRRAGARGRQGAVLTWVIEKSDGNERMLEKLTDSERLLPIAAIWNHELLIQRISDNWTPDQEG